MGDDRPTPITEHPPAAIPHQRAAPPGEQLPAPTGPPRPRRPGRRWPWVAGILAVPLACLIGAVTWLLVPLVRGTLDAARGGETPVAAVNGYVLTYGEWTGRDDTTGVDRWLSERNRDRLNAQRLDIIDTMRRVEQKNDTTIQLRLTELPTVEQSGDDRAAVTYGVRFDFRPKDSPTLIYQGHAELWTFLTVKERTGWKVTEVRHPPLCGAHFKAESC